MNKEADKWGKKDTVFQALISQVVKEFGHSSFFHANSSQGYERWVFPCFSSYHFSPSSKQAIMHLGSDTLKFQPCLVDFSLEWILWKKINHLRNAIFHEHIFLSIGHNIPRPGEEVLASSCRQGYLLQRHMLLGVIRNSVDSGLDIIGLLLQNRMKIFSKAYWGRPLNL